MYVAVSLLTTSLLVRFESFVFSLSCRIDLESREYVFVFLTVTCLLSLSAIPSSLSSRRVSSTWLFVMSPPRYLITFITTIAFTNFLQLVNPPLDSVDAFVTWPTGDDVITLLTSQIGRAHV